MSIKTKLEPLGGFVKVASGVADVACSQNTTWYIDNNGNLYGCGQGNYGQQGSGSADNVTTFTQRASNVASITCSDQTTWYLTTSGDLYGCGSTIYGQQGNGVSGGGSDNVTTFTKRASNVAQVAASMYTTWYIDNNGDLYGCGYGSYGQQSIGSSGGAYSVTSFTKRASNVASVACSQNTTWYIDNNGDLYGCGSSDSGQQGNNSTNVVNTFTNRASGVADVACSQNTTWYIDNNGNLYGCGQGNYGQQGSGSSGSSANVKTFTKRASNVKDFACSDSTTWYINNSGGLLGCGYNINGQQGSGSSGSSANVRNFTPRKSNVAQVAASQYTTWYINNNGDLYGCGKGIAQGANSTSDVKTFTQRASNVTQIACSFNTTWYIDNNGDLYGCGYGAYGQQGSGNTNDMVGTFTKRN